MRNLSELSVNEKTLFPLKKLVYLFLYSNKKNVADRTVLTWKLNDTFCRVVAPTFWLMFKSYASVVYAFC